LPLFWFGSAGINACAAKILRGGAKDFAQPRVEGFMKLHLRHRC
jgi:hypothetical protein